MSIIFSGDFQASWSNLDLCRKAWDEILIIADAADYRNTVVLLGDLKANYNPIDGRVVLFWQSMIRRAKAHELEVVILLGNHDRFGQSDNSKNWLKILRRAGANTFDKPGVYDTGTERLFMLPFASVDRTREMAKELLTHKPNKKTDILCFHQDLSGTRYNQLGGKSNAQLTVRDLNTSKYRYCIGGHIHLPSQHVEAENTYFVGSPFCQDWGEVNQRKRYLVLSKDKIRSVPSNISGWYDPSVDGYTHNKPSNTKTGFVGSRVRISVQCDASKDYGRRLESARRSAEKKYRGAEIFVIPRFQDTVDNDDIQVHGTTDKQRIRQYIELLPSRQVQTDKLIKYMLAKLAPYDGGLRTDSKVKFLKMSGDNFLSFKELELDPTKKGITLIQGINKDRNSKSNGSGKTSLTQLIPVAFFGKTFKEQKSDSWSNRWITKEPAYADITCKVNNKIIRIQRGRRPPLLQMWVNGKNQSSGMKSTDRKGTQQQIEQVTGFTWQTLANALYIDRTVADAFLSGTKKQRTDVLTRFQNLERFNQALDSVKEDYKEANGKLEKYAHKIKNNRVFLSEVKESLKAIKEVNVVQLRAAKREIERAERQSKNWVNRGRYNKYEKRAKQLAKDYKKECKHLKLAQKVYNNVSNEGRDAQRDLNKWNSLREKNICPMCEQSVIDSAEMKVPILKKQVKKLNKQAIESRGIERKYTDRVAEIEAEHTELEIKLTSLEGERRGLKIRVQMANRQYEDLVSSKHDTNVIIMRQKQKIKDVKESIVSAKHRIKELKRDCRMYSIAIDSFSRDGIPAFINKQLCPVLNKAATYYAELFSDNEVNVQFVFENGELVPKIINMRGGQEIDDQSSGERALAGLIASFALREVSPRCNLLILDEPAEGLDEETAKQFTRSLQTLVKRFKAIWVCSHNVHILSELSNERTITVRKHNKISRIV